MAADGGDWEGVGRLGEGKEVALLLLGVGFGLRCALRCWRGGVQRTAARKELLLPLSLLTAVGCPGGFIQEREGEGGERRAGVETKCAWGWGVGASELRARRVVPCLRVVFPLHKTSTERAGRRPSGSLVHPPDTGSQPLCHCTEVLSFGTRDDLKPKR
jgi:hypothetical protein